MSAAVVFAYHDVGVRCLSVLLAAGVDVRLVVTHDDNPNENIWFGSVAQLARRHRLPTVAPTDPASASFHDRVAEARPDFIFSFYYRHMLPAGLLELAPRGALNMHGSLLPRYRGRVPVNWAVIRGDHETGATLHYMTAKPDAGDIVDQMAVPILPDDTAVDVFRKVTCASEIVLHRSIGPLLQGRAPRRPQNLAEGFYCGGRRPEDGRIDWSRPAREVHDLVRGVAPPYPGAFFQTVSGRVRVLATRLAASPRPEPGPPRLLLAGDACLAVCGDGACVELIAVDLNGTGIAPAALVSALGGAGCPLT